MEEEADRVHELAPVRHARMLVSPFTFFRGAAAIMAEDLAATPTSGVTVQLCGDAHMSNFGLFASPERQMMFDVNDFDETYPGPWEWDVKRLAASFEIGGRDRGFDPGRSARDRARRRRAPTGRRCAGWHGWARSMRGTTISRSTNCSRTSAARSRAIG